MNGKKFKKQIEAIPILEIKNLEDLDYVWCGACKHVHTAEAWIMNDFICPSRKCAGTKGLPWAIIKGMNENLPKIPEQGKFYNTH